MPRRARVSLSGVPLHRVQRGNNRLACFFAPDDDRHCLDWLQRSFAQAGLSRARPSADEAGFARRFKPRRSFRYDALGLATYLLIG